MRKFPSYKQWKKRTTPRFVNKKDKKAYLCDPMGWLEKQIYKTEKALYKLGNK